MATTRKVLGQSSPSANTDTTLYTVPASTQVTISTISVCNRDTTSSTFRIAVRPDGAAIANQHYVCYDTILAGNSSAFFTIGITMDATDVLTVRSSTTNLSFVAFGAETV